MAKPVEPYPHAFRDRRITAGAIAGLAVLGGVAGVQEYKENKLENRPACIDIPVQPGEGPISMTERFEAAGLEPTGKTVVFKSDGSVLSSEEGFPSQKGSTELDRNDTVAVEFANRDACTDPSIGGTPFNEIIEIDKQ